METTVESLFTPSTGLRLPRPLVLKNHRLEGYLEASMKLLSRRTRKLRLRGLGSDLEVRLGRNFES